ncbi:MAG: LysR family transcriptional regulator [Alphaproteobacteria bacterium]|nr:LysR family transcriptional regulator [Alphaproteobacteria bacterium]
MAQPDRPFRTPLNAVRAFECAARLLSYTRAAEELGVTQGAVSRQIATLESYIGQPLFRRIGRGIALTFAGERYAAEVRDALAILESASARIMRRPDESVLIVGATAIASRWLIGRLAEFQRAHRALSVHLRDVTSTAELHGIDIAVLSEAAREPSLESLEILRERLIPVCSPATDVPQTHDALAEGTLLHLTAYPDAWANWFAAAEFKGAYGFAGPVFDDVALAIEAAIQGQGIAIAPAHAVETDIESGRLLAPFPISVSSGRRYHLAWPKAKGRLQKVRLFRDFILAAPAVGRLDKT